MFNSFFERFDLEENSGKINIKDENSVINPALNSDEEDMFFEDDKESFSEDSLSGDPSSIYTQEPGLVGRFIYSAHDEKGTLTGIRFQNEDHFNFAFDIVDEQARLTPKKTAMLHISRTGRERYITFNDMMKYSAQTANYLEYLGIRKGDRVMLVLKRHYQFWFIMLALHKIGAIAVPASFLLTRKDYEYRFKAAGIKAVIASGEGQITDEIDKAAKSCDSVKTKVIVNGTRDGWDAYNRAVKFFSQTYERTIDSPGGDDPMLMYFTSGTTSYPKMALHSYKYALGHYVTARYWHGIRSGGLHFTISDTGWGKAVWGKLYGQWMCEATVFTYDYADFYAKEILGMIQKYKISTFCAPPTVYRFLVHIDLTEYDLSSLQNVTTAGEALNPEIFRRFRDATGLSIKEAFGQTETTMLIGTLEGITPRMGSMGVANPEYDVHILRPDGTECTEGETGEICVATTTGKTVGLFKEYFQEEERTRRVWHDGFYHTGDTAYRDPEGYFWYVGRVDDIIKSAGYRVGPFEIENEIMRLSYVLECAVTSIPDTMRGQAIKASIVLADGIEETDALKKEIMKYLRGALASYKRPKQIEFVKELPKTSSGKVRRAEIKQNDWKKE